MTSLIRTTQPLSLFIGSVDPDLSDRTRFPPLFDVDNSWRYFPDFGSGARKDQGDEASIRERPGLLSRDGAERMTRFTELHKTAARIVEFMHRFSTHL